jgi:Winged helix DNA-binding domain
MTHSLTLAQARALWWHKQALAGSDRRPLAALIGDSGWLRTLGGADAYLAARARRPTLQRAELDAAIAAGELCVRPAVRGCIYLVPASAVPDLLALNAEDWRRQTEKELARIGKTMKVVEALAPGVLAALTGPMTTDALRKAMPGDIPSFGDAGKKVGLSSPLPLALRLLEFAGKIERTLDGGRLDTERYLWRKTAGKLPAPARDHEGRVARVIDAFLGFAGPATLAQLSAWSGHPQRDLKAAIARLDAAEVEVEAMGAAYLRRADLAAKPPPPRGTALLALEDNYLNNHGVAVVTDPRHHAFEVDLWGGTGKAAPLGKANHMLSRSIVVDGLIAGFWEVDPRSEGAAWHTFEPAPAPLARALDELTATTARFLLDELGHARVFTLDTMDDVQSRADRIAQLTGRKPGKPAKPAAKPAAGKPAGKPAPRAKTAAKPKATARA